jgi:hypothetical protein
VTPPDVIAKIATRIIDRAIGDSTDAAEMARALEDVQTRLESVMAQMVGETGFRALVMRALHLTRNELPNHAALLVPAAREQAPKLRWDAVIEQDGQEAARAYASALLREILGLLCSFIGDDLTLRFVRRAWTGLDESGTGSEPEGA